MEPSLTLEHVRDVHRRAAESGAPAPWTLPNGLTRWIDIGDDPAEVWRGTVGHGLVSPIALRRMRRRRAFYGNGDLRGALVAERLVARLRDQPVFQQFAELRMPNGTLLRKLLDDWLLSFIEALIQEADSSPRWAFVLDALALGDNSSRVLEDAVVARLVRFIRMTAISQSRRREENLAPVMAECA